MSDIGTLSGAFWDRMRAEMIQIAGKVVDQRLQNHRPRGAASVPLTVGSPGVALTTGLWVNGAKVPFPLIIDEIHIVADAVSDTQFDLAVQRPGQVVTDAASIVNLHYPELIDAFSAPVQEITIDPVMAPKTGPGPVWTTTFIEANSLLYLTVLATDAACNVVTFNIVGRCPA